MIFAAYFILRVRDTAYCFSAVIVSGRRDLPSEAGTLAACRLFSHGVIFTRARVSLALLSMRKNGGLLVVYKNIHCG